MLLQTVNCNALTQMEKISLQCFLKSFILIYFLFAIHIFKNPQISLIILEMIYTPVISEMQMVPLKVMIKMCYMVNSITLTHYSVIIDQYYNVHLFLH